MKWEFEHGSFFRALGGGGLHTYSCLGVYVQAGRPWCWMSLVLDEVIQMIEKEAVYED